jgi:hypothetical protein
MYGPVAIEFVKNNFGTIGIAVALLIVTVVGIYVFARRRMSIEA